MPTLKGTKVSLSVYNVSCILYLVSSVNVSVSHSVWPGAFWTDLVHQDLACLFPVWGPAVSCIIGGHRAFAHGVTWGLCQLW